MKPLTLGAGQLWVNMFPWKKWVLMIYEINHIWTAEMKWRNDRGSERSLCNCIRKPEKNSGLQQGLNPWPRDYRCDALPTELWSHWHWEQVNYGLINSYCINCVHCNNNFFISFHFRSSYMIYFILSHRNIWTHNWPAPNVSGFIKLILKSWLFFRLLYAIA